MTPRAGEADARVRRRSRRATLLSASGAPPLLSGAAALTTFAWRSERRWGSATDAVTGATDGEAEPASCGPAACAAVALEDG